MHRGEYRITHLRPQEAAVHRSRSKPETQTQTEATPTLSGFCRLGTVGAP